MDRVKKKFYEAMEDVLLQLVLDGYDRRRYRCAKIKGLMPPFDILIELLDYIPADVALDALRAKSDCIKPGHETDVYLYAIKKFDTEETKRLRRQRRKIERMEGIERVKLHMEEVSCDEEPPEDNIEVKDVVSNKEDKERMRK